MAKETNRTVALAVDESEHSDRAFNWYCENVMKEGDLVILIHVPESYEFTMASPAVLDQQLRELQERVKNLEKKYQEKLQVQRLTGKFRTESGKPGEVVIRISREENADVIITGTRGLGILRRTVLGSGWLPNYGCVPDIEEHWVTFEGLVKDLTRPPSA